MTEHLLDLAERARAQSTSAEAHFHAGLLLRAIDDFAASIVGRFQVPNDVTTRDVLEAYARDHAVGSAAPGAALSSRGARRRRG